MLAQFQIEDKSLQTVDVPEVEIFCEGQHGSDFYARSDLLSMIDAHSRLGFWPTVKADDGNDRRTFGTPALGYVSRLYLKGRKLVADLVAVPKRFAELIKGQAYKKLSIEVFWNYQDEGTGRVYPRALKAINFVGANLRLDSLSAIEGLYDRRTVAHVYNMKPEYRIYEQNRKQEERMNRSDTPTMMLGGLTATSSELARIAIEYAQENNVDFPTAVKELMRNGTRQYEQQGPISPANELAGIAKQVQAALKINFKDAIVSVARQHPAKVKQIADDWLIEQSRRLARGRPGFQSDNEAVALREVIERNPAVVQARNTGVLTPDVLRTLFPQWF